MACEPQTSFGSQRAVRQQLLALRADRRTVAVCAGALTHAGARPGDVRDSQADRTRLRALFTDIQPVDFRAGLEATVRWFHADQQRRVITVPELAHR